MKQLQLRIDLSDGIDLYAGADLCISLEDVASKKAFIASMELVHHLLTTMLIKNGILSDDLQSNQ